MSETKGTIAENKKASVSPSDDLPAVFNRDGDKHVLAETISRVEDIEHDLIKALEQLDLLSEIISKLTVAIKNVASQQSNTIQTTIDAKDLPPDFLNNFKANR
ncbi:MAG: hypothetical protein DRN30_00750 [Thermoplasmata archaeon]|nr:MAG: hypothetical protein DRN30_00750 [Thermoplasmata archaeon]